MKARSIVTIAAAVGIFSMTGVAFASSNESVGGDSNNSYHKNMGQGMGKGMGQGQGQGMRGYDTLTPEKQELYTKIVTEADKEMAPLNEKMSAKRAELDALYNNPESEPAAVGKVAGELAKMRTQMRDMQRDLSLRLEKEVGIQPMGRGHKMGEHRSGMMGSGN